MLMLLLMMLLLLGGAFRRQKIRMVGFEERNKFGRGVVGDGEVIGGRGGYAACVVAFSFS